MPYLLALVVVATLVVLLWKSFGPQSATTPPGAVGPDDDPDFLRGLGGRGPDAP